jgi:hypothetical protein
MLALDRDEIRSHIKTTIHGGGNLKLWEWAETPNGGEKGESRITTLMW